MSTFMTLGGFAEFFTRCHQMKLSGGTQPPAIIALGEQLGLTFLPPCAKSHLFRSRARWYRLALEFLWVVRLGFVTQSRIRKRISSLIPFTSGAYIANPFVGSAWKIPGVSARTL